MSNPWRTMKPLYFFLLLVLLITTGRGDKAQEILVEEGDSVSLGERTDFDTKLMMADLYIGDEWMASYQDGLDVVDQYKGRLNFHTKNGSFLLRDLTEGDSGNYTYSLHQAINGKRNMTQIHIHLTVREQNSVTAEPRGTSPDHRETSPSPIPSYSARDIMWQLSICLAVLSLLHPLLCLCSALWRCCQGGQAKSVQGVSFSSILTSETDTTLDIPSSTNRTTGGGTPLCCTLCMKISGYMSLGSVWFSLLFYLLYDNGDLRMMVWVLLGVAVIVSGINILPLFKCCKIPHEAGVSVFPYGSLCSSSSSRERPCSFRLLEILSLALVLIFTLCLFLSG